MSEKTEACTGIAMGSINYGSVTQVHCPGCTSATERIAELGLEIRTNTENAAVAFGLLVETKNEELTAMRTIAGELAGAIQAVADSALYDAVDEGEPLEVVVAAALAMAKKMGINVQT